MIVIKKVVHYGILYMVRIHIDNGIFSPYPNFTKVAYVTSLLC